MTTALAVNAQIVGANPQELANQVQTFSTAALVDLAALEAGTSIVAASTTAAGTMSAADKIALPRYVRGVVIANVANLASFTVSNNGITYVAGDRVLLPAQTTAAQNGVYAVGTVASGTAPLTRVTDMPTGMTYRNGCIVHVSNEGTLLAASAWKAMCTGTAVVGTNDPVFYPQTVRAKVTLVSGTKVLGSAQGVFLYSATTSGVTATRNTAGGTLTLTTHYFCPDADRVAGVSGTGAVSVTASVAAGTVNTADTSTVDVLITNW